MPTSTNEPCYNPATVIRDGEVIANEWQWLPADTTEGTELPEGKLIVPLHLWQRCREQLQDRSGLGVWLDSDQPPALIAGDLDRFELVAVNFPVFTDGRGFSYGRELREQHGFSGELRAIGAFIRDQLHYLRRCGFNAFALETAEQQSALDSLRVFSEAYQASIDQPEPLFRRR